MNKPKILYLDDEIENLQSFRFLFKRDFDISIFQSPYEALEILQEEDFSIVISDSRMPKMSGVEFLKKAKELKPDVPRILITGYVDYDSILEAINQAAISKCIHKPYETEEVRKILKSFSSEYLTNKEFPFKQDIVESFVVLLLDETERINFINKNMENLMQENGYDLLGKNFHEYFFTNSHQQNEENIKNQTYSFSNANLHFYLLSEDFKYGLKNKKIVYGYYKK